MTSGGLFVVLVGPDGVGKTTIARHLLSRWDGERRYFHFRPPIRRPMRTVPPAGGRFMASKEAVPGGSVLVGCARILYNAIRFWLGYAFQVRPALRRGALVVGDRWGYGYLAQPAPLRFYGPRWLAELVVRSLPRPHLTVCLTAAATVVRTRKGELSERQIVVEDDAWRKAALAPAVVLDTSAPPELVVTAIMKCLDAT